MRALLLFMCILGAAGCSRGVAGGEADGPAIFKEICARCHGENGVPPPSEVARLGVPDLTAAALQQRLTDDNLRLVIRLGSPKKGMPGFSGSLTDQQLDALIQHVRTLQK